MPFVTPIVSFLSYLRRSCHRKRHTKSGKKRKHEEHLLANIKRDLDALRQLLAHAQRDWHAEDFIYRYYHHSFKVFGIQRLTLAMVQALRALLPECPLNTRFARIIA